VLTPNVPEAQVLTGVAIHDPEQLIDDAVRVETGGDPGHAPARRLYEQLGFGLFPIARYFKKL
jgi:hypothetical protein